VSGLLPTTVVGSYSVPEWLERLKTDYYQRRISTAHLNEIHDVAIKAALKDQELAGVDVVSDGELRRDNDIDYLLVRIPGVEIPHRAKTDYYDYYEAQVTRPLPAPTATVPPPPRRLRGPVWPAPRAPPGAPRPRPFNSPFPAPFSFPRRSRNITYADPAPLGGARPGGLPRRASGFAGAGAVLLKIDEP